MDDLQESAARRCNSMQDLRDHPEIAGPWSESLENVKRIIANRFRRLQFDEQPVEVLVSIPTEDISLLQDMQGFSSPLWM